MPPKRYRTVSLPETLIQEIDEYIESNRWGYDSRPDVIKAAVHRLIEQEQAANEEAEDNGAEE